MIVVPFATFAGDNGAPLVFLHGIGGGPDLWRFLAACPAGAGPLKRRVKRSELTPVALG